MKKHVLAIGVVAMITTSLMTMSCKNNGNVKGQATEQADTTATADSVVTEQKTESEAKEATQGDRPTFNLVGDVKSCKWKNMDSNETTTTYVFDNNGKLTTINGRKEQLDRNKDGQIKGYSVGENGLTQYSYKYDTQGRVKWSQMYDADSGTDTYTYTYDAKGLVSSRDCDGEISEMGADEAETYHETVTYEYKAVDAQGNWTKRVCHGATGRDPWTETRTIVYY